ncbi:MAG: transcription-repair coupling factor, partial [Clostridiales bacterium]|nr:transcription-repair coupling factor [Clostridiales bacterium]
GQTFILYNRVESIDSFAYGISKLFNEEDNVRITVAHGQMSGAALDDKMTAFYNGEADLLICTTIIENGLDLPNANTIIIYDADKLGLATLYQLRGRVGRSGLVAHAYFTYKSGRVLGENAMKRLNAIMDYTDFGSGYKLAMRDLEIRGAGNILGAEQHGHMEKVGYEMYSRMLRQAVGALRGEVEVKKETEVRIQTDLVTYIDDSYAAGERKIEVYSRLAALDSKEKKAKYLAELTDTLGAPPESVLNLAEIALAKNIAAQFDAERILVNDKGLGVIFNKAFVKNTKLIQAIARDKSVLLAGDAKTPTLLFRVKNMSVREKLERIEGFFEKLKVES